MNNIKIKPITGTWFSIYWHDRRHFYWNSACMSYTPGQWDALIADLKAAGLEYIVMCNCVSEHDGLASFPSKHYKMAEMATADPLEQVLSACDRLDMKVFMSNDYVSDGGVGLLLPENIRLRNELMAELAEKYGHHKSFYGWYWANESYICPYFNDEFIEYINISSKLGRELMPNARILTAPYGTGSAVCDDKFCAQLDRLDVDIIAYQDTVGCYAADVAGSERAFEQLRKAHDRVPRVSLWADVETFTWEGNPNDQKTPLIPAEFSRLEAQLKAVSPYVDRTLVFIFEGLFSNPESIAYTGYEEAGRYWNEYMSWLEKIKQMNGDTL